MSESPFPQNPNLVLAPEWVALAKIGQFFGWVHLWIILSLIYMICLALAFLGTGAVCQLGEPELVAENHPFLLSLTVVSTRGFCLVSLILWILMLVRFGAMPESIVPGGGIARAFVIFSVVFTASGLFTVAFQAVNAEISASWIFMCYSGLLGIFTLIFFLICLWRLAKAVESQRAQSCVTWFVNGNLIFFISGLLLVVLAYKMDMPPEPHWIFSLAIAWLCLLIVEYFAVLSFLNTFGYLAKDVRAFIQKRLQEDARPQGETN